MLRRATLMALALLLPASALAGVTGYWKTIDDDSKRPRSIVHITEDNGEVQGKIVQLYREPDEDADPLCKECNGELQKEKVIGLTIMKGLHKDGDSWDGGTILDPHNGKTYGCYITEQSDDLLKVRGYIGFSLLGRTQHWHRVQAPDPNVRTYLLDAKGAPMPLVFSDGHEAPQAEIDAHLGKKPAE